MQSKFKSKGQSSPPTINDTSHRSGSQSLPNHNLDIFKIAVKIILITQQPSYN